MQGTDGTVSLKEAAEIGAVKQTDGTVALKDDKGELKVLPKTGMAASLGMSFMGVLTLVGVGLMKSFKKE